MSGTIIICSNNEDIEIIRTSLFFSSPWDFKTISCGIAREPQTSAPVCPLKVLVAEPLEQVCPENGGKGWGYVVKRYLMGLKQCHKPSPSHHHK